jgi:histone-binding protein RBBP4
MLAVIPHDGEVNRVRHNPHEFTRIASRTAYGEIHIFNTSSTKKDKIAPELKLSGHDTEGYALEWNPNKHGYIISGSYDGKLSLWDTRNREKGEVVLPLMNFSFHQK